MALKNNLNKKDKILVKDAALAVADSVVAEIAKINPAITVAYALCKALFGAGLKLRQDRALEWVEMVRDNPSVFIEDILNDASFQDGFVVALEKYLTERNENKRVIFKNIFLGFTTSQNKQNFPLEKYFHTLSQLNEMDIEVLKDVKDDKNNLNYLIYGDNETRKENIHNLINEGILFDTTGTRGGYNPANSPFVKISSFGLAFKKYIAK